VLSPENLSIERTSREWSGLFDNLIIYGLMGIAFGLFFVFLNHLVEYGFFVLLFVWILGQLKNGTLKWIKTPLDIPILLYVAWVLICVPLAVDPDYSFGEWRKVVAHFLLFYFVVQTVKTKHQMYSVFLAVIAGMVVLSVAESIYFLGSGRSLWSMSRGGDLWGSGQWFSSYLVMGLPLLWMGWDSARNSPRWYRIVFGVGLGISLLGLFLAHTRAGWVAIGMQIFIYVLLKFRSKWWAAFGGAGLLVCVLLVMVSLPSIRQELSSISIFTNTVSMQWRFNTWSLALQDIAERPLAGIGLGNHSFSKLHPDLGSGFHANLHNTFLGRAVQIGIPGFLFFFWIFIVIVARAAPISQSFSHEMAGKLALATSLIVVGVIVRNLFDDMFIGTLAYLFWFLIGLFFSMEKVLKTQNSIREA